MERCISGGVVDFSLTPSGGSRQFVQSPGEVSIAYDIAQGHAWQRAIPVDGSPHLPSHIRGWWGDSRGRWEGNTLVVDVTNFAAKAPVMPFSNLSSENVHVVERWTRTSPNTLEYVVTLDDPTTWTKPWTVKQDMTKQSDEQNRVYKEPRCHEGNFGLIGILAGARAEDKAFAEGRGPNPATLGGSGGGVDTEENVDVLR